MLMLSMMHQAQPFMLLTVLDELQDILGQIHYFDEDKLDDGKPSTVARQDTSNFASQSSTHSRQRSVSKSKDQKSLSKHAMVAVSQSSVVKPSAVRHNSMRSMNHRRTRSRSLPQSAVTTLRKAAVECTPALGAAGSPSRTVQSTLPVSVSRPVADCSTPARVDAQSTVADMMLSPELPSISQDVSSAAQMWLTAVHDDLAMPSRSAADRDDNSDSDQDQGQDQSPDESSVTSDLFIDAVSTSADGHSSKPSMSSLDGEDGGITAAGDISRSHDDLATEATGSMLAGSDSTSSQECETLVDGIPAGSTQESAGDHVAVKSDDEGDSMQAIAAATASIEHNLHRLSNGSLSSVAAKINDEVQV